MAYRETTNTLRKKASTRLCLLKAARSLVQNSGFKAATAVNVATESGMATGTIYRHFVSKSELVAEVFRFASQQEVDSVAAAVESCAYELGNSASDKIIAAVETFSYRALRGKQLAFSLIAEPVDQRVEHERLRFRVAYADIFKRVIEQGIEREEFVEQDVTISAAALVGLLAESLLGFIVGPANPYVECHHSEDQDAEFVGILVALSLRTLGAKMNHPENRNGHK